MDFDYELHCGPVHAPSRCLNLLHSGPSDDKYYGSVKSYRRRYKSHKSTPRNLRMILGGWGSGACEIAEWLTNTFYAVIHTQITFILVRMRAGYAVFWPRQKMGRACLAKG